MVIFKAYFICSFIKSLYNQKVSQPAPVSPSFGGKRPAYIGEVRTNKNSCPESGKKSFVSFSLNKIALGMLSGGNFS